MHWLLKSFGSAFTTCGSGPLKRIRIRCSHTIKTLPNKTLFAYFDHIYENAPIEKMHFISIICLLRLYLSLSLCLSLCLFFKLSLLSLSVSLSLSTKWCQAWGTDIRAISYRMPNIRLKIRPDTGYSAENFGWLDIRRGRVSRESG